MNYKGGLVPYKGNKRWREKHPGKRSKQRSKNYEKGRAHARKTPSPYTEDEDHLVLEFEDTDRELGEKISRSVQSIQIRRARLKSGRR